MIELTDDGTLDTVLRCSECGEEIRYNYDGEPFDRTDAIDAIQDQHPEWTRKHCTDVEAKEAYTAFVEWAIEDATDDHGCPQIEEE